MGKDSIQFDPVADGLPDTFGRFDLLIMAFTLVVAVGNVYLANYRDAITYLLILGLIYLVCKTRRRYWLNGYAAAIKSTSQTSEVELFNAQFNESDTDGD